MAGGSACQGMKQNGRVSYVKLQLDITLEQSFLGAHANSRAKNFPRSRQVQLPDFESRKHQP
jgi:hypothetical protein